MDASKAPDERERSASQTNAVRERPTKPGGAARNQSKVVKAAPAPPRLRGLLEPNELATHAPAAPVTTAVAQSAPSPVSVPSVPPAKTSTDHATSTPGTPATLASENGSTHSTARPVVPVRSRPATPAARVGPPAVGAPEPPTRDEPRRRNTLLLLLLLVAVAGVLGLVALIATMVSDSPSVGPAAAPAASTEGTLTDPTGPASTSAPGSVPPGGSTDGLAVVAAVISPTTIEVVEIVHWPDGGPAVIELELSENAASSGGLSIAPEPRVESLQVSVDGSPVVPTLRNGSPNRWLITPPSGAAPGSMEIRYLLEGAIVRSVPASPGRALAVITPISSSVARDLPVSIAIVAADVLNVYCPAGADQAAIMCGRLVGDRWTVTPPPGLPPLVVAQLDLPALT